MDMLLEVSEFTRIYRLNCVYVWVGGCTITELNFFL